MNRRGFLKLGFAAAASVALAPMLSQKASAAAGTQAAAKRLLKGTADGRVLESLDGGKTWQTLVNFGNQMAITRIAEYRDGLLLQMRMAGGHSVDLRSGDNGRTWHTLQYHAPGAS